MRPRWPRPKSVVPQSRRAEQILIDLGAGGNASLRLLMGGEKNTQNKCELLTVDSRKPSKIGDVKLLNHLGRRALVILVVNIQHY